jgi:dTDP-glucose pyrophosphorylase
MARGLGRRMQAPGAAALDPAQAAAADAGRKAMIPFGRPFLDYVLHGLAEAGIPDAGLVLGPEHDSIREYYRTVPKRRIRISFIEQAQPLGTADAVLSARDWTGTSPFIVLNADNLYPEAVLERLGDGTSPALPAFARDALGLSLERIGTFALVETNEQGALARIVEKPGVDAMRAAGPDALVSMNIWRFDEGIFPFCRDVPLSSRGERELPQAVELAVQHGMTFEVFPAQGPVLDLSSRADVAAVSQALEGRTVSL